MHELRRHPLVLLAALSLVIVACVSTSPVRGELHRWWEGLGPVLPHDTFPGDCKLCHEGQDWNTLARGFTFDHERETGVPLVGAHAEARCLLCHNDRGPVAEFQAKGCAGCHEDVHQGELGDECASCHRERDWRPVGQVERHARTRFPLVGAHAVTACHKCHAGAWVGNFVPTDTECLSCHRGELADTRNPPHLGLGWVDNCQRCHMPTSWHQATIR